MAIIARGMSDTSISDINILLQSLVNESTRKQQEVDIKRKSTTDFVFLSDTHVIPRLSNVPSILTESEEKILLECYDIAVSELKRSKDEWMESVRLWKALEQAHSRNKDVLVEEISDDEEESKEREEEGTAPKRRPSKRPPSMINVLRNIKLPRSSLVPLLGIAYNSHVKLFGIFKHIYPQQLQQQQQQQGSSPIAVTNPLVDDKSTLQNSLIITKLLLEQPSCIIKVMHVKEVLFLLSCIVVRNTKFE